MNDWNAVSLALAVCFLIACGEKQEIAAPPAQGPPPVVEPPPVIEPPPVVEPPPVIEPPQVSCAEQAVTAYRALDTYCATCHQAPAAQGGMDYVLEADTLRERGRVVPFEPLQSPLYLRVANGSMPPPGRPAPGAAEVSALEGWIDCGAQDFPGTIQPPGPIGGGYRWGESVVSMRRDIGSLRPADALNTRYVVLGQPQGDEVGMLINSLSSSRAVISPDSVEQAIVRLDLRDYGLTFDDWELLVEDYPYAIRHDLIPVNSERFDAEIVDADAQLRVFAGTEIAYIYSDWFLGNASRAPLYYDLLKVPGTLQELQAQLGLNIEQNIADELVVRAGFNDSGVSENNRVIERHDLFATGGYFWASYDFINSAGDRNIFADPINFAEDGGEFIWTLPNGLQGYAIAEASGTIIAKAPTNVVKHIDRPDGAVEAGISCMGCHHADGIIAKRDTVRDYVAENFAFGELRDATFALYPDQATLQGVMRRDAQIFTDARARAGRSLDSYNQPVLAEVLDFEAELDIDRVAASFGVSVAEFSQLLGAEPDAFPPELGALRSPGGTIKRDAFDRVWPQAVCALGLGEPICRGTEGADGIGGTADDITCLPCSAF